MGSQAINCRLAAVWSPRTGFVWFPAYTANWPRATAYFVQDEDGREFQDDQNSPEVQELGKQHAGPTGSPRASEVAVRNGLGFLGLAAEESRDVQIVGGNVLADFADVLLDLVDDVRQCVLHRRLRHFATGLPGLRQEGRLLVQVFLVGVLESAENDVGVFVRGLLNDARCFVDFVKREAGAAGNVDQNSLSTLNGI